MKNALMFFLVAVAIALGIYAYIIMFKAPKITEFNVLDWNSKSVQWQVKLLKKLEGTEILNSSFQAKDIPFSKNTTIRVTWEAPDNISILVIKSGEIVDRKSVNFTSQTIS